MLRPASTLCLPLRGEGGTAIAVTDEVGGFCLRDAVHLISHLSATASPHRGSHGVRSVGAGFCSARSSDETATRGRSRAPPLQSAPQEGNIHLDFQRTFYLMEIVLRQLAANLEPSYQAARSQKIRKVTNVWNDT